MRVPRSLTGFLLGALAVLTVAVVTFLRNGALTGQISGLNQCTVLVQDRWSMDRTGARLATAGRDGFGSTTRYLLRADTGSKTAEVIAGMHQNPRSGVYAEISRDGHSIVYIDDTMYNSTGNRDPYLYNDLTGVSTRLPGARFGNMYTTHINGDGRVSLLTNNGCLFSYDKSTQKYRYIVGRSTGTCGGVGDQTFAAATENYHTADEILSGGVAFKRARVSTDGSAVSFTTRNSQGQGDIHLYTFSSHTSAVVATVASDNITSFINEDGSAILYQDGAIKRYDKASGQTTDVIPTAGADDVALVDASEDLQILLLRVRQAPASQLYAYNVQSANFRDVTSGPNGEQLPDDVQLSGDGTAVSYTYDLAGGDPVYVYYLNRNELVLVDYLAPQGGPSCGSSSSSLSSAASAQSSALSSAAGSASSQPGGGADQCVGRCGDGVIVRPENCDDGNTVSGDGCSSTCQIETETPTHGVCQDSLCVQVEGSGDNECDTSEDCRIIITSVCGNGTREAGEDCDDGNVTSGDGCDASCAVEPGWQCEQEESSIKAEAEPVPLGATGGGSGPHCCHIFGCTGFTEANLCGQGGPNNQGWPMYPDLATCQANCAGFGGASQSSAGQQTQAAFSSSGGGWWFTNLFN